jgi:hypothetical protein
MHDNLDVLLPAVGAESVRRDERLALSLLVFVAPCCPTEKVAPDEERMKEKKE